MLKNKTRLTILLSIFSMGVAFAECHTEIICTVFEGCGPQVICTSLNPPPPNPNMLPTNCRQVWICPSITSPGTDCHWETICGQDNSSSSEVRYSIPDPTPTPNPPWECLTNQDCYPDVCVNGWCVHP